MESSAQFVKVICSVAATVTAAAADCTATATFYCCSSSAYPAAVPPALAHAAASPRRATALYLAGSGSGSCFLRLPITN